MEYVGQCDEEKGCFLCRAASGERDDAQSLVVARGQACLCVMNRYPYSNGHLLIAPYRHEADLAALTEAETAETMRMISRAVVTLRQVVNAHGLNVGWNLGRCAGAGLADHLHAHVVPRWPGDTNFMPALSDVKVIPQALDELWRHLREAWPGGDGRAATGEGERV